MGASAASPLAAPAGGLRTPPHPSVTSEGSMRHSQQQPPHVVAALNASRRIETQQLQDRIHRPRPWSAGTRLSLRGDNRPLRSTSPHEPAPKPNGCQASKVHSLTHDQLGGDSPLASPLRRVCRSHTACKVSLPASVRCERPCHPGYRRRCGTKSVCLHPCTRAVIRR